MTPRAASDAESTSTGPAGAGTGPKKRKPIGWIVAGIVVCIVLVIGGVWWFLRDDAPAEVTLGAATQSVTTVAGQQAATLPGTWTVDSTSGSFDYSSATGTFAGFRIDEELAGVGSTTAVGRTGSVTGSMTIDGDVVTAATFTVDMTSITTDREQRDRRVQSALDTGRYPEATFTLTEPITLPADAASGADVTVDATGDLTIHGVTRSVVVPLEAKLTGSTVVVVGSIDLTFSDFGVEVPSAPIVLSANDHGTMELQLLLTKD